MKQALLTFLCCFFLLGLANAQVAGRDATALAHHQREAPAKLSLFPNPTTHYFQLSSSDEVAQIIVFNVVGRKMKDFPYLENDKYYVDELPNGMYLVQFVGHNGKILSTRRLSKR
ncbi:MAG: T9SS type A sorting domain-containing protein [Bacteroidota bacterium]